MARRPENDHEANDSSFLDVITNCVGILIILVIVVGQHAKNAPILDAAREAAEKLAAAQTSAVAMEQDVQRMAAQLQSMEGEARARAAGRTELNTLVTAVAREIEARRAELDEKSRAQYDLDRDMALAAAELERLEAERRQVTVQVQPQTIKVESYPTPIGKTVDGKEAHFQLLGGRIVFVPFEAFISRLKDRLREHARDPEADPESVDTLGPIGGFRMRYGLERFQTPQGIMVQVSHLEMIPTGGHIGEPIAEALAPHSRFRDKLEMLSPHQYTITVWTYEDSFAEYRQLKKELYGLGYQVAARPLLDGMPIAASPNGSKSSAQ